ncbi:MAG: hypothetical protein ACRDMZ_18560, partial [Solirubrobacteraceae bacterium]
VHGVQCASAPARSCAEVRRLAPCEAMVELELTRTAQDRRLYAIEGVGTLRLEGLWSRRATAEAGSDAWLLDGGGLFSRAVRATDAFGIVVGEFRPAHLRRGGRLTWRGRELALRPASRWRERYALADGDAELALLDAKGRGRRPVKIGVEDLAAFDPGLLLMAAFVARGLAEQAASSAA